MQQIDSQLKLKILHHILTNWSASTYIAVVHLLITSLKLYLFENYFMHLKYIYTISNIHQ